MVTINSDFLLGTICHPHYAQTLLLSKWVLLLVINITGAPCSCSIWLRQVRVVLAVVELRLDTPIPQPPTCSLSTPWFSRCSSGLRQQNSSSLAASIISDGTICPAPVSNIDIPHSRCMCFKDAATLSNERTGKAPCSNGSEWSRKMPLSHKSSNVVSDANQRKVEGARASGGREKAGERESVQ